MAEEQLRKAVALMKQGNKQDALKITQAVIKQDRNNINAWWLTANLFSDQPERQKKALERVLAINPLHKGALKLTEALEQGESVAYQPKSDRQRAKPSEKIVTTQEIEMDWSKLEAQEAKNKAKGEAMEEHHAARIATIAILGFVLVAAIFVFIFVGLPILYPPPNVVVVDFYETFFAGEFDSARKLVCADQLERYDNMIESFGEAFKQTQWEFTNLAATVVEQKDNTATVTVSGRVTMTIGDASETLTIAQLAERSRDDTLEPLRKENGQWCIAEIN